MTKQRRHILLAEVEGKPAICFDTGLEPRSFARTKMSQSLVEKGYIVHKDGSYETWASSGVCEFNNHMRVWGKPIDGKRFDTILNNAEEHIALKAVVYWIKAKMFLGDTYTTFNPAATFIAPSGSVFFAPPNLANRCLHAEGAELDYYNCPDLVGMNAVAFSAAAMLYKIFAKSLPYSDKTTIYQDMREGVFVPLHIASPGLNKELCHLIQSALFLPVEKRRFSQNYDKNAANIIKALLALLSASSLYYQLSAEEIEKNKKEQKKYLFKQNLFVKTRRFAAGHKVSITISVIVSFFILFIFFSTMNSAKRRPTTEGMSSHNVVHTYYNKFTELDHIFLEACTMGSDPVIKSDINAATTYFAIVRTRQSYEGASSVQFINARAWKDAGLELPAPNVFGVTDLELEHLSGDENSNMIMYRVNYNLWIPNEHGRNRTDTLTLQRDRRGNWRITEILRTER